MTTTRSSRRTRRAHRPAEPSTQSTADDSEAQVLAGLREMDAATRRLEHTLEEARIAVKRAIEADEMTSHR